MTPFRWIALAVVIAAVALVVIFVALRPRGLPERSVSSVPPLRSQPAGVPGEGLVLAPNGLGAVSFATDEETAFATLTDLLGAPVEDFEQVCNDEGGEPTRMVRWGTLTAAFWDGWFKGWIIGIHVPPDSPPLEIETAEGIGAGDPVSALEDAYGDRLDVIPQTMPASPDQQGYFGIDGYSPLAPTETGLGGLIEAGADEGRVITLIAGQTCGP